MMRARSASQAGAGQIRSCAGKAGVYVSEHRLRCNDGSWRWVLERGQVVRRSPTLEPLQVSVSGATDRLRALLFNLEPPDMQHGLTGALSRAAEEIFETTDTRWTVDGDDESDVPDAARGARVPGRGGEAKRTADRDRRDVAGHVVQPTALGGVERKPEGANQDLARARRGDERPPRLRRRVLHDPAGLRRRRRAAPVAPDRIQE